MVSFKKTLAAMLKELVERSDDFAKKHFWQIVFFLINKFL